MREPSPSRQTTPARSRTVLVVEDDSDAQDISATALRMGGFEVETASTIAEAVSAARRRKPDAVVLDCRLPDGDGLTLARLWSTDPEMKSVPIVVLTAFSARQDVEAALVAGADAFLVKPCPAAVLVKQVERVLQGVRPSQRLRRPDVRR